MLPAIQLEPLDGGLVTIEGEPVPHHLATGKPSSSSSWTQRTENWPIGDNGLPSPKTGG